jgi:hypothetical protein
MPILGAKSLSAKHIDSSRGDDRRAKASSSRDVASERSCCNMKAKLVLRFEENSIANLFTGET